MARASSKVTGARGGTQFLTIRLQERRGVLRADLREQAERIPCALGRRTTTSTLAEPAEFIRVNGHQPRHSPTGIPADEIRLREWASTFSADDPVSKSRRMDRAVDQSRAAGNQSQTGR